MNSSFNVLIEKNETGYSATCPEIAGYKVTSKIDSLKLAIESYLISDSESSPCQKNRPIWEIAQDLIQDMTEEEISQLPIDGAEQHDHYIYGTPKQN